MRSLCIIAFVLAALFIVHGCRSDGNRDIAKRYIFEAEGHSTITVNITDTLDDASEQTQSADKPISDSIKPNTNLSGVPGL